MISVISRSTFATIPATAVAANRNAFPETERRKSLWSLPDDESETVGRPLARRNALDTTDYSLRASHFSDSIDALSLFTAYLGCGDP